MLRIYEGELAQEECPHVSANKQAACLSKAVVPSILGLRDPFHGRQFFQGAGFWMTPAHYTYCALGFYYCYISDTSDHQALDPGGRGTLL